MEPLERWSERSEVSLLIRYIYTLFYLTIIITVNHKEKRQTLG